MVAETTPVVGTATVVSGIEKITNNADVVGLSIGEIRSRFGDLLNISEGATALVGGDQVEDSYVVENGDEVIFSRILGSKG